MFAVWKKNNLVSERSFLHIYSSHISKVKNSFINEGKLNLQRISLRFAAHLRSIYEYIANNI